MTSEMTSEMTRQMTARPRIELVYDRDCPNVEDCRTALRTAILEAGESPSWNEWDRNSAETPPEYRAFGSPTVLVNGRDIHADVSSTPDGNSCRVYTDEHGRRRGSPSITSIVTAITDAAANASAVTSHAARGSYAC